MTLKDIFECLRGIDRDAQALIKKARFSFDAGIGESVCMDMDDPEHLYLEEEAPLSPPAFPRGVQGHPDARRQDRI